MEEKENFGFTLIETLVVISITGILTAMALGYTRQNTMQIILVTEQAKLAGMLQRAKTLALQGLGREEGTEGVCYGVSLNRPATGPHHTILFRTSVASGACSTTGETMEQQNFDSRIIIDAAAPQGVVFRGPTIQVFVDGSVPLSDMEIFLEARDDTTKRQKVTIGAGGSVSTR